MCLNMVVCFSFLIDWSKCQAELWTTSVDGEVMVMSCLAVHKPAATVFLINLSDLCNLFYKT